MIAEQEKFRQENISLFVGSPNAQAYYIRIKVLMNDYEGKITENTFVSNIQKNSRQHPSYYCSFFPNQYSSDMDYYPFYIPKEQKKLKLNINIQRYNELTKKLGNQSCSYTELYELINYDRFYFNHCVYKSKQRLIDLLKAYTSDDENENPKMSFVTFENLFSELMESVKDYL